MRNFLFWIISLCLLLACRNGYQALQKAAVESGPLYRVTPVARPWKGDPEEGFRYLANAGYVGSGVPFSFMEQNAKGDSVLYREGLNGEISYLYNVFPHANGTQVVSGNCFNCHASPFMDSVHFGLGDSFSDFTEKVPANFLKLLMRRKYGKTSPEWEAFYYFGTFYQAISPRIQTDQYGVNPAFRLEEACAAKRNPVDLSLTETEQFPMSNFNIASDVPPLWNVKKKDALYYNGMGRGDYRKLLMQASVLGIKDSSMAREILHHFDDVLVWLESLEAPKYPKSLDPTLVVQGKSVFEDHCQKCHGKYGPYPTYPNKIVGLNEIQTDPLYARYFVEQSGLPKWYNESWFANSSPSSQLLPSAGYIAPPLDGIWATAPYLHNGSVPTLEDLLYSPQRPTFWKRKGEADTYDWEKVGWQYETVEKAKEKLTYDTQLPGYGNQGHYFGDSLNVRERKAVLEYLKSL